MRWILKPKPDPLTVDHLRTVLNVNKSIASLLAQRGVETFEQARDFFRPSLAGLHNPYLMKDMKPAVKRILKALDSNENILVYGDYDVDGTTSVALVASYLRSFYPQVATYIPDRYNEGYGISYKGIDFASDNDVSLIIALDCGIKAIDEIAYAAQKGIDFIICDHHRPGPQIPDAVAVLDPKQADCNYPYKELSGCGVGFKLLQALHEQRKGEFEELYPYLDLVAAAIGADIVPVTGENRILVHYGLKVLNTTPRPGFKAIINHLNNKKALTLTDVAFLIGPRINAAGRMKHGGYAVELLTEQNPNTAQRMAAAIEQFNSDRKITDRAITQEALDQIEAANEQKRFTTVVYKQDWHKGVIGIVASRLTETYYRPTLVFTRSGETLSASARSVRGFDIYDALECCSEHIEQFGGHKYAAGLTLHESQFKSFKEKFEEVVATRIDKSLLTPELSIDATIKLKEITPRLLRILKQFEPYGPGNPKPLFMASQVQDTGAAKCVGQDKSHLKCRLKQRSSSVSFDGIGFGLGNKCELLKTLAPAKLAFTIEENQWNGVTTSQLNIRDIIAE